jgi:hypothetical protein
VLGCVAPFLDFLLRGEETGEHAARMSTPAWRRLVLLLAACALATLVNPYHVRLYAVVLEYARQPGPYRIVSELTALEFRDLCDWSVLALALAAAFALGRRPRLSAFDVLLLAVAAYFSFRARRDLWFMTLAALAILTTPARRGTSTVTACPLTARGAAVLVGSVGVVMALTAGVRGLSAAGLERAVAEKFPARAVAFVEGHGYAGPVYNHFNWGGYLTRALPRLPVGLDGRTNLHGDERLLRIENTWAGRDGWEADPELSASNLVIADATMALTALLRRDGRFEVAYEDSVAVVFVRRDQR